MKTTSIYMIILAVLMSSMAKAQEYRLGVEYGFNLLPRLEAGAEAEVHKSFFPESYFVKRIQVKMEYDLTKVWSLETSFTLSSHTEKREEDDDEDGTETEEKCKWTADLGFEPKRFSNDLKISNRLRYECSKTHEEEPTHYIRDKITLDCKITKAMNPYVALEPYYQPGRNRIRFVRFYIGNEMPVFKTKVNFYYISELEIRPGDNDVQYILGLSVCIK